MKEKSLETLASVIKAHSPITIDELVVKRNSMPIKTFYLVVYYVVKINRKQVVIFEKV